jgi:hypothetical protein
MSAKKRKSNRATRDARRATNTVRNPYARPRSLKPAVTVLPPIVRRNLPRSDGQWASFAEQRGRSYATAGFPCWSIWHRCLYRSGVQDRCLKVFEVPTLGVAAEAGALRRLQERMVGFDVEKILVYAVDKITPPRYEEHGV